MVFAHVVAGANVVVRGRLSSWLYHSLCLMPLRQGLSLNPELIDLATLAQQRLPKNFPFLSSSAGITGTHGVPGFLRCHRHRNSPSYVSIGATLLTATPLPTTHTLKSKDVRLRQ